MGLVTPVAPVPLAELGRVHFTDIGGAGMSGIARIMIARGVTVSGSDSAGGDLLASLAALGADVHVGHAAANLDGADTVVVSSAIRPDNPELAAARAQGLRVLHRAAALASVMLGRRGVAVAGTHGKTTTTSMITTALRQCGADPGYVIGGILTETGLGAEDGSGQLLVAEADESDGSFLMLSPEVAVVTCVEADHLDNYASLAEIEDAFAAFARRIVPRGALIACADDPGARSLAAAAGSLPVRVRTYGEAGDADYRITSVTPRGMRVGLEVAAPGGGPPARLEVAERIVLEHASEHRSDPCPVRQIGGRLRIERVEARAFPHDIGSDARPARGDPVAAPDSGATVASGVSPRVLVAVEHRIEWVEAVAEPTRRPVRQEGVLAPPPRSVDGVVRIEEEQCPVEVVRRPVARRREPVHRVAEVREPPEQLLPLSSPCPGRPDLERRKGPAPM